MGYKNIVKWCAGLLCAALATPLIYNTDWLQSFVSPKVLWFSFFVDVAFGLFICVVAMRRETLRALWNPVLVALCVFTLALSISGILGVDVSRSFWGSLTRFHGLFVWWQCVVWTSMLVYLFRTSQRYMDTFVVGSIWIAVCAAMYGIAEFIFGSLFFPDLSLPRAASFFGNPIYFANYLTVPLFLSLFIQSRKNTRAWLYRWVIPVVLISGVLVSASRGAFIGLAVGLALAALVWLIHERKYTVLLSNRKVLVVTGGLVCAFVLLFSHVSTVQRLVRLHDQNLDSRLLLWHVAWKGFLAHPWLGVGPENYSFVANQFFIPELYTYHTIWNDKPHNAILEIAVTSGVFGLLAYVSLMVACVWTLWRAYRVKRITRGEAAILVGALIAYTVQNMSSFDTISALLMFCLLLGVIAYCFPQSPRKEGQIVVRVQAVWLAGVLVLCSMLFLTVYVYLPTIRVLRVMGKQEVVYPTSSNSAESVLDKLLTQRLVIDRGFVSLSYADAVLMKATSATSESKGLLSKAIGYLESAARKEPTELQYWLKLGDLYIRQALLSDSIPGVEAEHAIDRAKRIAPNRAEVWFALGELRFSQHRYEEAGQAADRATELNPQYSQAIWLKLSVLIQMSSGPQAQQQAERVLEQGLWPDKVEDLQWLFDMYAKTQDTNKLVGLLDMATAHYSQNIEFQLNAANAYIRLGQNTKAKEILYYLQDHVDPKWSDQISALLQLAKSP